MKRLIINKTILTNIRDSKFLFLSLGVIVFLIAGTLTSMLEYSAQCKEYTKLKRVAEIEKNLENVKIIKRPNKLMFAHEGGERNLPKYLIVIPDFVDYPIEDVSLKSFTEDIQILDWSSVVGYFFSLIALLITFDLVSGEKERGILKLILSHPVSRNSLIFGNFWGAWLSLIPFLSLGFLVSISVIMLDKNISLNFVDLAKIFLVVVISIVFISVMILLGIFISTLSGRSSTTLIIALAVWVLIAIIIPNGSLLVSEVISPTPSFKEFDNEVDVAEKKFDSKIELSSMMLRDIYTRKDLSESEMKEKVTQLQKEIVWKHESILRDYKGDLLKIRESYLRKLEKQMRLARVISRISPVFVYMNSVEGIVGTGYAHQASFHRAAEEYMREYTLYANKLRDELIDKAKISGPRVYDKGYEISGVSWVSYQDVKFDKTSFPKFEEKELSVSGSIHNILIDMMIMAFFMTLFFMSAYVQFLAYDAR